MGAVGVVLEHMLNNFVFTVAMKKYVQNEKRNPSLSLVAYGGTTKKENTMCVPIYAAKK